MGDPQPCRYARTNTNLIHRPGESDANSSHSSTAANTTSSNRGDEFDCRVQDELRPLYEPCLPVLAGQSFSDLPTLTQIHALQSALQSGAMDPSQTPNISELLKHLGSRDDPVRKMAAFKLQSLINDPSFAELFVHQGGLPKLRLLVLESSGNTLAYGLASFARLLDVDQGWEAVDNAVVEKVRVNAASHALHVANCLTSGG